MADDQQNPFTMMGMMQMMQPNKYIPASEQGQPLKLPGFYGTPTDATGKPIQSYLDAAAAHDAWDKANPPPPQGTTLNSNPGITNNPMVNQLIGWNDLMNLNTPARGGRTGDPYLDSIYGLKGYGAQGQTQGAGAASASRGTNPIDMRQAYLDALANPGDHPTQGAAIPASKPLGQPSVLDAFLAAHPGGGGAGAGNYNNSGFFNTLNRLRSS